MNDNIQTIVAFMLPVETEGYGNNDMIRRVYDPNGIAPCIRTFGGGNQEPKIVLHGNNNDNRWNAKTPSKKD